ncbi:MAG: hypothetical protein ACU0DI_02065, partial [Paracoccaceae bacterium]
MKFGPLLRVQDRPGTRDKAMVNEAAQIEPPRLGEPYLLTPGPLTTSYAVKQEMLRDWGSRDSEFRDMTEQLRDGLLA